MKKIREGYKMTELGEIPQEWDVISFFNFIEKIIDFRGRTPKKLGMDWGNGNIVALSANNVKMGKIDFNLESYYASEELYKKWMSGNELSKGDILMTMEAPLGNIAIVPDNNKYILSQRVVAFKTKDFINNTFMKYMLMSDIVQSQLEVLSTGTTAKGINQKNLAKAFVIIPTLKEQEKIASILSTVDEQIDNVDALIEKNKELKKGLMQTLLTKGIGHTKFKKTEIGEIPQEWELKNLRLLIQDNKNISYGVLKPGDYTENGVPMIRIVDIKDNKLNINEVYKITDELDEQYKKTRLEGNEILISLVGTIGRVATTESNHKGMNVHRNIGVIPIDKKKANKYYICYSLSTALMQKIIDKKTIGGNQPLLNLEDVRELKIIYPPINEQEKIASILLAIDEKIKEYDNKKQKLEQLKKGLMQQLLTGKIRVINKGNI